MERCLYQKHAQYIDSKKVISIRNKVRNKHIISIRNNND